MKLAAAQRWKGMGSYGSVDVGAEKSCGACAGAERCGRSYCTKLLESQTGAASSTAYQASSGPAICYGRLPLFHSLVMSCGDDPILGDDGSALPADDRR
ncbi:unnamed protein product [Urochloa humidicola]